MANTITGRTISLQVNDVLTLSTYAQSLSVRSSMYLTKQDLTINYKVIIDFYEEKKTIDIFIRNIKEQSHC